MATTLQDHHPSQPLLPPQTTTTLPNHPLNWLGTSIPKADLGGNNASLFIIANICLWSVSYFGIYCNLIVFFTDVLDYSNSKAASDATSVLGSMSLFSVVGALVADTYLGRLWTAASFQILNLVATISITICTSLIISCRYSSSSVPSTLVNLFYISVYLSALPSGAFQPALLSLGADQFDTSELKSSYFTWYFAFYYLGFACGTSGIVYAVSRNGWTVGFSISTGLGAMGLIIYMIGIPTYTQYMPRENPFSRGLQVLVATLRKWNVKVPLDTPTLLYEEAGADQQTRTLLTEGFGCFNKASVIQDGDWLNEGTANPWKLCTITQVEEVKCFCRLIPIWISGIFFYIVNAGPVTLFVEQGATMDTQLGSFNIEPPTMNLFRIITAAVFPMIYRKCLEPYFRTSPSPLQRMTLGYVSASLAMLVAAVVETRRLTAAKLTVGSAAFVSMSILWLIPQYVLLGIAQFFLGLGHLEFFYVEAPPSMRSVSSSLSLTALALGSYVSSLLLVIVDGITTSGGKAGWISKDLNEGHLDYFYWLVTAITIANLVFFIRCGIRFQGLLLKH